MLCRVVNKCLDMLTDDSQLGMSFVEASDGHPRPADALSCPSSFPDELHIIISSE